MPLHFYAPAHPPCKLCGEGFEHHASTSGTALTTCPTCGQSVIRQSAQTINTTKLSAPMSVSRAKQSGFVVLKRTSDGSFENQ